MNDINRAAAPYLFDPSTRLAIRQRWSELVNSERRHELRPYHHLLYLAILGKDWRKAFTPITRPTKLKGHYPYEAGLRALGILRISYLSKDWIALFGNLFTEEMLDMVRARLPKGTSETDDHLPDAPYINIPDAV